MFCPQCGQQQPDEAVRFCKRCGFPVERLAEFVGGGGQPESAGEGEARALSPRQRGARLGLVIMLAGLLFSVLAMALTTIKQDLFVFLPLAALVFMVGVVRLLYGLLLEGDGPPRTRHALSADNARREALEAPTPHALPHARTVPVHAHAAGGPDTTDMAAPLASVTEQTTKLLEEE